MNNVDRFAITWLIHFAIMVINKRIDSLAFFIFCSTVIAVAWCIASFIADKQKDGNPKTKG